MFIESVIHFSGFFDKQKFKRKCIWSFFVTLEMSLPSLFHSYGIQILIYKINLINLKHNSVFFDPRVYWLSDSG